MRKLTLIFILLFIIQISYSQNIDSAVYYSYIKDPGIDTVFYYSNYYKNGDIKERGWKFRSKRNNSMFEIKDTVSIKELEYFEWKVGLYKEYYKGNRIKRITNMPRNINDTIRTELYNKKGALIRISKAIRFHEYDPKYCPFIEIWKEFWIDKYEYSAGFKNGRIEYEVYMDNSNKTQKVRRFNKKGEVVKEELQVFESYL